ncbi:MAG: hypothetical protein AAFR28_00575 [Pseudomonadota bacterium]
MKHLVPIILSAALVSTPALSDAFEDNVEAALEAYRGGDYDAARRHMEQADRHLDAAKAAQLGRFLPPPFTGWRRIVADPKQLGAEALGGAVAQAAYTDGEQTISIKLVAGSALASSMAAMRSSFSYLSVTGQVEKVAGQNVVVDDDGSLQGLIDSRIVVEIEGEADVETKKAYFAAIDAPALSSY